jgi:type III pantothenate kinase
MNLIVDIGNSRVKWAEFKDDVLVKKYYSLSKDDDIPKNVLKKKYKCIMISSTGKSNSKVLSQLVPLSDEILQMDYNTPIPILLEHYTPETLGLDRKAACVGASVIYPNRNCLVFDAGTALTIDLLLKDRGMVGGNISPGLSLRFEALHNFTANLPLLSSGNYQSDLGKSTEDSIINGVQHGILHEVEAYICEYKAKYPEMLTIITGGDAQFFVKNLKSSIFVQPDIVVIGLNRILKYYAEIK